MNISSLLILTIFIVLMVLLAKCITHGNSTLIYNNKIFSSWTILFIIVFSCIAGLRYDFGYDYLIYLDNYNCQFFKDGTELGFLYISKFLYSLGASPVVFFGFLAYIQISFFVAAYKEEKYLLPLLSFFLITSGEFLNWMNIIRCAIAITIFIYSIKYIAETKIHQYLICCLLAFLFHKSSIIIILCYPIFVWSKDWFHSTKVQLLLVGIAFIIRFIFAQLQSYMAFFIMQYQMIFGDDITGYGYYQVDDIFETTQTNGSGLAFYFNLLINIIIIINSQKLKLFFGNKKFQIIYGIYFIGLFLTYVFPPGLILLTRPFRYFYSFGFIVLSFFTYYIIKNTNKTLVGYGIIVSYYFIFALSQLLANKDSHMLYQFYPL